MSFQSFADFIAMGGHGLYVWLCYGVGLIAFLSLGLGPVFEHKRVLKALAQQQRRQENDKRKTNAQKVAFSGATKNAMPDEEIQR